MAAVEVARAMGARVIAAASSAEKCALAIRHGADEAIDYGREDLREGINRIAGKAAIDVVFDPVGGSLAEPAFRSLAPSGRHLVIGFASGTIPSLPYNLPLVKSASLVGVYWGAFARRKPDTNRANMARLFRWFGEGFLKPQIDCHFPLEQGGAAIRYLMDRRAQGKVVVDVGA